MQQIHLVPLDGKGVLEFLGLVAQGRGAALSWIEQTPGAEARILGQGSEEGDEGATRGETGGASVSPEVATGEAAPKPPARDRAA